MYAQGRGKAGIMIGNVPDREGVFCVQGMGQTNLWIASERQPGSDWLAERQPGSDWLAERQPDTDWSK